MSSSNTPHPSHPATPSFSSTPIALYVPFPLEALKDQYTCYLTCLIFPSDVRSLHAPRPRNIYTSPSPYPTGSHYQNAKILLVRRSRKVTSHPTHTLHRTSKPRAGHPNHAPSVHRRTCTRPLATVSPRSYFFRVELLSERGDFSKPGSGKIEVQADLGTRIFRAAPPLIPRPPQDQ